MHSRCGFDNLDNREKHQLKNNIKYLGLILEDPTAHTDTVTASISRTPQIITLPPLPRNNRVFVKIRHPSMPLLLVKTSFSKYLS